MPITKDMSDNEIDQEILQLQKIHGISDQEVLEEAKEVLALNGIMHELYERLVRDREED